MDNSTFGNLQKYTNTNPLQRILIARFLARVLSETANCQVEKLLDVGCAEGFVAKRFVERWPHAQFIGTDIDDQAVQRGARLHPSIAFLQSDATCLPFPDEVFDLVICTEMMEHLTSPQKALAEIHRVTRSHCLLSVPHEPLFRLANLARGKHVARWGNDPEHVQHWNMRSFCRLVSPYFRPLAMYSPFPWLVVLGSKVS